MKQKVLFICPSYFNYHTLIRNTIKDMGYEVDLISYKSDSLISMILSKIGIKNLFNRYSNKIANTIRRNKYDILFVIKGEILTPIQWKKILSDKNIPSKYLYQWDSIKNVDYRELIPLFDRIFSFDRLDCNNNQSINYLPLFYNIDYSNPHDTFLYDLLFVGIWHSDRITILDKIYEQAVKSNLKVYFKIYYPFFTWLLLKLKGHKINSPFLTFRKVSKNKMNWLYNKSRCIIDIAHPSQTGLTMRTMECIGANKKLVTTNKYICQERFYDSSNIYIIDRRNPVIDFSFLKKSTQYPFSEEFHIKKWIKNIFQHE